MLTYICLLDYSVGPLLDVLTAALQSGESETPDSHCSGRYTHAVFFNVELFATRTSPVGIPRDIYRGLAQIKTNVPYCL